MTRPRPSSAASAGGRHEQGDTGGDAAPLVSRASRTGSYCGASCDLTRIVLPRGATVSRARPFTCRFLATLAVATLAVACSSLGPTLVDERPPPVGPTSTTAAPPPEPPPVAAPASTTTTDTIPPPAPSKEWTLLAGGDVLMDRTEPLNIDPFEFIEPALASADLAVVNSEMAISDRGTAVDKAYVFRAPPSAAERIASAGVDVANLANNHARDYGPVALMDTVELLEAAGVVALGAGANDTEAFRHRILNVGEAARVAFVGVSMIVPWNFTAGPDLAGIASDRKSHRVTESVRNAADEADVVIAVIHWGIERDTCPSSEQRMYAQALLDAGADAVIGHHPHVLQPIEFADGRLVAYSLGNFVWHPRSAITGETGVLQIDFDADRIVGWTFHPHLLDENGAPRPAEEGRRLDRIRNIVGGNCEPYRSPPPPTTTTTQAETESESRPTETDATGTETEPTEPAATEPDTTEPTEPTEPDTTGLDATPDPAEPDTTETDITEPTEPDTTEPDTAEPDTTEPDTTEPDSTEPEAGSWWSRA